MQPVADWVGPWQSNFTDSIAAPAARTAYFPLAILDAFACMVSVFVVLVFAENQIASSKLADFMAARITVKNLLLGPGFLAIWLGCMAASRRYRVGPKVGRWKTVQRGLMGCVAGSCLFLIFPLTSNTGMPNSSAPLFAIVSAGVWLAFDFAWLALNRVFAAPKQTEILVVGSGPIALGLYNEILERRHEGFQCVGFIDEPPINFQSDPLLAENRIGTIADLERILARMVIDQVWIALPLKSRYAEAEKVVAVCERVGIESKIYSGIFQKTSPATRHEEWGSLSFIAHPVHAIGERQILKRCIDICGALLALVLLSWVFLAIAVALGLSSKGPIFYVQPRIGHGKRVFRMFKFRTMVSNAEELQASLEPANELRGPVFKIKNDPRVTVVGRLLRRTSLDELPQLINVLVGDMSLVGPRPLPARDVDRFEQYWPMRRFAVRPGITGLWQISGRSDIDFENWMKLDLLYVDHWSVKLDLLILFKTLPAVLARTGAY